MIYINFINIDKRLDYNKYIERKGTSKTISAKLFPQLRLKGGIKSFLYIACPSSLESVARALDLVERVKLFEEIQFT